MFAPVVDKFNMWKDTWWRFYDYMKTGTPGAIACGIALGVVAFCIFGYFTSHKKVYIAVAVSAGMYLIPFFMRGF